MAQPGSVTRGFGGRVLSVVETTEGTVPTNPAYVKFSDYIQSVGLSIDPDLREYRDIGSYDVGTTLVGLPKYGLKVSFYLHTNRTTQLFDAIARQSNNSLKSVSIEVSADLDGSAPGYFTFSGCKPSSVSVKSAVGEAVLVEVTYSCLSVSIVASAPSIGTGSRESAALGALCVFSTSTFTRGGSALAFVTRSAELRVTHALDVQGDDGQVDPKATFEGRRGISGSCDISVDDGGVSLATVVKAGTAGELVLNLGASGAPKLTVTNARWQNLNVELNSSDGWVKSGVPFMGESVATGTVA